MARLMVLAIFLLAATLQVHATASRADVNDVRLNDLHQRIESIHDLFEERDATRASKEMQLIELEGRVGELNGHDCPERSFRCSTHSKICVHDMLVCDGANDCPDGSDETEDLCHNPAHAGATFVGQTYESGCSLDDTPASIQMDVIGEKRWTDFPSLVDTTVLLTKHMADGSERKSTYHALYSYGQKTLVVYPHEGDGVAMTCRFRTSHSQFCHAKFLSIVNKHVCGEAVLHIQHH